MQLQHPSFPDITKDVPDEAAADWTAAGWTAITPATPVGDTDATSPADTIGVEAPLTADDQDEPEQ